MDEAFDARACALPACESGNIIGLAAAGVPVDLGLEDIKSGALRLKRDTGLNLLPTVARIARLQRGISDRFAL
jgi:spermidine synthase